MTDAINWGPAGEIVYNRTYSRVKPDGSQETWPETVERVVDGNLALVDERYQLPGEREDLIRLITEFKAIPAGRHLWASGVKNAQHLFNCWVAGWTENPSDHFEFTFMRLMEGGGVGANYSNRFLDYGPVQQELYVHVVCDPEHPDYEAMKEAGVLSTEYDPEWAGAFVIEDSREGWAAALVDLIETHYRDEVGHFQRVYDVSRVRPFGAKLKTFGGRASGPLPLARMLIDVCEILSEKATEGGTLDGIAAMEIDHAIAQCVVAGGVRRSARMAMMHWNDPQIREFMRIKQDTGKHWTTNISVEVDAEFWRLVAKLPEDWDDVVEQATARDVLDGITHGMVTNGEPGFWDSSLSNVGEPNQVICTNPCGEITLEAWEPCNLGHINLAAFVKDNGRVDYIDLIRAHRLMTRFLIRATFSPVADPKSREVLDRNRRIGVGHLGVASFLAMTNKRFSQAPSDKHFRKMLRELAKEVDIAAERFSHELRIPVPVKKRTVAPTGTIAKMPGVSEGIHPIFARYFYRRIRFSVGDPQIEELAAQGYEVEKDLYAQNTMVVTIPTKDTLVQEVVDRYGRDAEEIVESADDLTLNELLAFQALYQQLWADNAVSFTANVDPETYTSADVRQQLRTFGGLLKGATIFPESSMPQAPYERITKAQYEAATAVAVADGVDEECANGACPIR
ncbi:ribonucleotide reductase [Mycobacterium phage Severus]|uniref:ribonucleotide reductase n=1 Tax=Mycobacterium phage Severus TaxID=1327776 RepID=UPI00032B8EC4|nr:ribonucleotide reductase [Mycobacterium phage Severus]YP_009124966.1 ribonucleotide reductase [Mycobacterium phage Trike]QWS69331.1 ribonucleotide reductase [Mycobacterium Phage PeaceMeal1]QZD97031.1 ribonucleotide reductase [Mycobacterium phage Drake94]USL89180.1 ribonucleotide reductase [Mycobacterium phage Poompha]AGK87979.1 ribonucleotide reductase [Mycobacterium phage Severus]AIK69086.1 ribonucleotide reductase [Mycobacterium phage Trike]